MEKDELIIELLLLRSKIKEANEKEIKFETNIEEFEIKLVNAKNEIGKISEAMEQGKEMMKVKDTQNEILIQEKNSLEEAKVESELKLYPTFTYWRYWGCE